LTARLIDISIASMDPYVYPGTSVLRNLRDIRDPELLSEFEAEATARRLRQLENKPTVGPVRCERHLQAIHRHIFQDVYEWAGDFRTVNISKSGDPFAFHQHIVSSLDKMCGELKREGHLAAATSNASPAGALVTSVRSTPFIRFVKETGGHSASSSENSESATD
jgi:fido (protein-threonine AMPylation protein)